MAKAPAEIALARFECPCCHETVEVRGRMVIKVSEKGPQLFDMGVAALGVKVALQGVVVNHDCRKDYEDDAPAPV